MRALACLVFIALAYTIQGDTSPYIIGGKDGSIGKFPYQVSLRLNGRHDCSGSILNNRNILTAARCVVEFKNELGKLKVHVGTNFLNESGDVYDLESVSIHENYTISDKIRLYDIALVHLKTPLKYSRLVQPISLMTSDQNLEEKSCTLSGWRTNNYGKVSNNLQEYESMVYPQEDCEERWGVKNTLLCTFTRRGEGACNDDYYDTGSPLVANGVQIGISLISYFYHSHSCLRDYPNVHANVTSFIRWIITNLKY